MEEGIARLQDRQLLDRTDFLGVDYSPLYMCKAKRGIKREDSKEAYKLPHRLIEKKRRDRINECIGQLKDLLPEHLKLTTLGHLEKAVVLELTLKHLNALTAVTEQQHQKIIALQSGDRILKSPLHGDSDAFHSGFQACAREVIHYLSRHENWSAREPRCAQLIGHLHKVSPQLASAKAQEHGCPRAESQGNCVPVIQRTHTGELNENDTDTDSGYGGEPDKGEQDGLKALKIKQEYADEPPAKMRKVDSSGTKAEQGSRADVAILNSIAGLGAVPFTQQAPFYMPFYVINPSAAASYMPLFDKANIDKYFFPAAAAAAAAVTNPFPLLYPGFPAQAAAAAAAVFPGLSSALSPNKSSGPATLSPSSDTPSSSHDSTQAVSSTAVKPNCPDLDSETAGNESTVTGSDAT